MLEYWYDKKHTGTLRVIDYNNNRILGSDPNEPNWIVYFDILSEYTIDVDWHTKNTHRGHKRMIATYENRRNILHWPDGNKWLRIRVDPHLVLNNLVKR